MNTEKLDTFQVNVKRLSQMTAEMAEAPICGLGPPKVYPLPGGGEARVWILHERESVSIAKAHVTPNGVFPEHHHEGLETIIVFEGSALYESASHRKELFPGDCVSIPRNKPHRMTAGPEGAWFSVTLVPREEGLGNVR